jgi:hypothetical protein
VAGGIDYAEHPAKWLGLKVVPRHRTGHFR